MPVYLEQQAFSDATLCLINQYKKNVQVVFIESGLVEIIIYENYNDREEFNYIVGLYMNQVLENLSRYFKPFSTLNFFILLKLILITILMKEGILIDRLLLFPDFHQRINHFRLCKCR